MVNETELSPDISVILREMAILSERLELFALALPSLIAVPTVPRSQFPHPYASPAIPSASASPPVPA